MRLGTLIALMVAEGEDWKQVEIPPLDPVRQAAAPPTAADRTSPPRPPGASALKPSVSVRSCLMHVKAFLDAVLRKFSKRNLNDIATEHLLKLFSALFLSVRVILVVIWSE